MLYFFFILFLVSGFIFGIIVFVWALKNGQFKDQQRARYLALDDDEDLPQRQVSRSGRFQAALVFGLLIFGLMATVAVMVYAHLI
jgi:cbb3-type cytochrome oxidase maturation protein